MNATAEVTQAANALTSWTIGLSNEIKTLSQEATSLLERNLAKKPKVDRLAMVGLDKLSREFLAKNTLAVGAGVFFAAEYVEEDCQGLEWWYRDELRAIRRLDFDLTPGSDRYYDYEHLPFFSNAASTGEQTLWGPYIDYLGIEEYILTFTTPFSIRGNFTGVAGCDIRLKDLEPLILPTLRTIPNNAALVNASNRVILGNSGMYLVGERIKSDSPNQSRVALDVPHLGLSLVYTA